MVVIYKQTHKQLYDLGEKYGIAADDMLRVLAWCPNNGGVPHYYTKDDSALTYFECSEEEKIRLEIARWSNAFRNAMVDGGSDRPLSNISPALHSIFMTQPRKKEVKNLFARTLRMLLFLEFLLLRAKCSPDNPYGDLFNKIRAQSDIERLRKLVDDIKGIRNQDKVELQLLEGTWIVSLPLLLIVAVAECQCEHIQPFAWEAYSAARARDELRRKWTGINENVLNTIALFIRCQSAVGQNQRGSGTSLSFNLVNNNTQHFVFSRERIFKSLQLLAMIEEARNHKVPVTGPNPAKFDYDAECDQSWEDDEQLFKRTAKYLDFIPPTKSWQPKTLSSKNYTWSYFRPRYLGLEEKKRNDTDDVKAFRETILHAKRSLQNHELCDSISVGRIQTERPLKPLIGAIITDWRKCNLEESQHRFSKFFRLQPLEVPHPFSKDEKEYILQVLLRDDLAAEQLLFPTADQKKLNKLIKGTESREPYPIQDAGGLFKHLFDVARKELNLSLDTIWDEKGNDEQFHAVYAPYPLIRRVVDIIYRLKPSTCFSVPISIDRSTTEWIRLPYGIKKSDHLHKRVLANFILATVLNRAMGRGLSRAEIDIENLAIPSLTSQPNKTTNNKKSDNLMKPQDWRKAVQQLYVEGGYNVLLERYLRDYNSQRNNIHFETHLSPDTHIESSMPEALAVGSIDNDLEEYLNSMSSNAAERSKFGDDRPDFRLIGVDIGGTLTKCQLFDYSRSSKSFDSIGKVFRMSTPPVPRAQIHKHKSVQDAIRENTDEFAMRLVELVKQRAGEHLKHIDPSRLVIGLAWPGPVRENHPNGTSGLLKEFGLSHIITQNRIDDIWEVDIASAVSRAWRKEFKNSSPFVSLLNDGDADAVGAVVLADTDNAGRYNSNHKLAVVKLGTGLAGATLQTLSGGLSLVPGLYEWGKIVLDVAAPTRLGFPRGVAGEYLSKKCLPRLTGQLGAKYGFFQHKDEPDSAEIGLILETARSLTPAEATKAYRALRVECGSIQGFRRHLYGVPVSAEVLRVVYNDPESDPNLLFEVRLALREFETVNDSLVEHLDNYGRIRLHRLIGYAPNKPSPLASDADVIETRNLRNNSNFKKASQIAESCAQTLGRYLGDFCVMLYDEFSINEIWLTGGVLTGETGKVAINAAEERVRIYGLRMHQRQTGYVFAIGAQVDEQIFPTIPFLPSSKDKPKTNDVERGALGAACFAAASFIQDKKQKGLQKLRSNLLEVGPGKLVTITGTKLIICGDIDDIDFCEHALSECDLINFLKYRGPELGFYQTDNMATFVRWK